MIRTLLLSENPLKLSTFYQSMGLGFDVISIHKKELYVGENSGLCIAARTADTGKSIGGILTISPWKDECENFTTVTEVSGCFTWANAFVNPKQLERFKPLETGFVSILRHTSIEEGQKFFDPIGEWVKEKHERGPWHFSHLRGKHVIEIYPRRKSNPSILMEFLTDKESLFPRPDLKILAEEFEDPEGRKIRLVDHLF